jgi:hypothetical protein
MDSELLKRCLLVVGEEMCLDGENKLLRSSPACSNWYKAMKVLGPVEQLTWQAKPFGCSAVINP